MGDIFRDRSRVKLPAWLLAIGCALTLLEPVPSAAAVSAVTVPAGVFAGLSDRGPAPRGTLLRIAIELQPPGDLDGLAARIADPNGADHRATLDAATFNQRFGRVADGRALGELLAAAGIANVWVARHGLIVGAILQVEQAEQLFNTRWNSYGDGRRMVLAPAGPLTVPAGNVRDVRGAVVATTPRLDDVRVPYTGFRGNWYLPVRFREMYDAIPDGGTGKRIVLVEDASDAVDLADIRAFTNAEGAPPGADAARVTEQRYAFKAPSQDCGRDDRGQEAALDISAALTMAPRAQIAVVYDDVCSAGNDGTGALARALELDPTTIAFPFSVGPVRRSGVAATYGNAPLPFLEAIVRGIAIVASSGDDGAFGYREPGIDEPAVVWPCVLPWVVCAGGTQLGERDTIVDEAPWNDALFAGGGGISPEPRPAWQDAPSLFELSPQFIRQRMVPDVSADAAGHLRIFWHGYGLGGIGGTSESAAIVAAQLAAIAGAVPAQRALATPGDLYVLAKTHPEAFRDVSGENDRRYFDNTVRPRIPPPPKDFHGVLPSPPPYVYGCKPAQPQGCTVRKGYDAVTGIGSIKERAAVAALRGT